MATVSYRITSISSGKITKSGVFGSTYRGNPTLTFNKIMNNTEVTKSYTNTVTVTSTPTSIDLTNLTDEFGAALSFSTIKHLHIINNSTTQSVFVGGGTNGLFTELPFQLIGYAAPTGSNGSDINLSTNITVDATHKILKLYTLANSASVNICIAGA